MSRLVPLLVAAMLIPALAWADGEDPIETRPEVSQSRENATGPASAPGPSFMGLPTKDDNALPALDSAGMAPPFLLRAVLLGDSYQIQAQFPRKPYPDEHPGYLWLGRAVLAPPGTPAPLPPTGLSWWSLRASVEKSFQVDGISRVGGEVRFDTDARFGVLVHWNAYREVFPCGCTDNFFVGDLNATFRFAQHELAVFYAGIGCRMFADQWYVQEGLNLVAGFDLFPIKPVVISGLVDGGTLGSAGVIHARGSVGITRGRWELMGGYDFLRIGWVNLQGPFLGVRLWF